MSNQEKAYELWFEYKSSLGLAMYGKRRIAGYIQRVKNLAKRISLLDETNIPAIMYLDHIGLWLDIDLEYQK
ncbi:MAG: hypothetical protein ACW99F_17215 [Candidatus Hodarchaeales archaeon]|jgi:hypothetical protein